MKTPLATSFDTSPGAYGAVAPSRQKNRPRKPQRAAIILAGGDGTKLSELTQRTTGSPAPKHLCALLGDVTLLQMTRNQVALSIPPELTIFVVEEANALGDRGLVGEQLDALVAHRAEEHAAHHLAGSHQRQCPASGRANHHVDDKTHECVLRPRAYRQSKHSDDVGKNPGAIGLLERDVDARGIVSIYAPEDLSKPHSESFGLTSLGRRQDLEHARLKAGLRTSPGHVLEVAGVIDRPG